jgi:histidine decarboxylase
LAKRVNNYAALTIKLLADFMPNNLGNWSINKPNTLGKKLEKQIVEIMKNYYQSPAKIAGHFTSGSTEGNIYAAWIGRNYLIKKLGIQSTEKISFLFNSLTHYSISKAADLINVKSEELAIDQKNWNIDLDFLNKTLEKLYKKGIRAFLIPLTIGYTVTGTEDNVEEICKITEKFKKNHKGVEFFLWLDAAFSGVSKIFTENDFKPFDNKSIQLITTDFHKLLAVPYSSGLVLYRNTLTDYIKRDIPYIGLVDTTLLGSRSGMSVIATWFTLINLNKKKLRNIFLKAIAKKEKFLKTISQENLNLEIINNPDSIQTCLICKDKKSLKLLATKYQLRELNCRLLFSNGYETVNSVKLYFFPKFN